MSVGGGAELIVRFLGIRGTYQRSPDNIELDNTNCEPIDADKTKYIHIRSTRTLQ